MDATDLWTLDQLAEQVESGLAIGYPGAPNGRVRSVPDRRAIRWYTTIGLVDRPAAMRGRTALYARRHLLQLVAIKRRQAEGRSLAEIQAELTGATDATLQSIAQLPEAASAGPHRPPAAPRGDRFWTAAAANAPASASVDPASVDPASVDPASAASAVSASAAAQAPAAFDADVVASPDHDAAVAKAGPAPAATGAAADIGVTALGEASCAPAPPVRRANAVDGDPGGTAGVAGVAGTAGDVGPAASRQGNPAGHGAPQPPAEAADRRAALAAVAPAVVLPGGITLLLPAGTPYPGDDDIHAIRAAIVPLLAELSRRGLSDTESTEGTP